MVNLGVMVSQEEFISAAIETGADAIMVSSLYGQGELDCRGLREKCDEAGLKGILLYVGGNIVIGKHEFSEVEKRFTSDHHRLPERRLSSELNYETRTFDRLRQHLHEGDRRRSGN